MRIVVWITERSWEACVDEVASLAPAGQPQIVLVAVPEPDVEEVAAGGRAGLLGRHPPPPREPTWDAVADAAAKDLLEDAAARLGRPAAAEVRHGRPEREIVAACAGADLLILARDGDDAHLGPRSLGRHARFVVDHAPCRVLLIWPDGPPGVETIPPPPEHPPGHEPPPPPGHPPPPG